MANVILVAGASGNLGGKIVDALLQKQVHVRALVRKETDPKKINHLRRQGAEVLTIDLTNVPELARACTDVSCVVSALSGLREVILDGQTNLLDAAVQAGVPRFIPSDYCLDFTKLIPGTNRNLDLRREFHKRLEAAPIQATTIFNGVFMDLLVTTMPLILNRIRRILYWGDPRVTMDMTTIADVAEYTARVAIDQTTPRYLRIAGDRVNAIEVKKIMTEITRKSFSLFRGGSIQRLNAIIRVIRFVTGGEHTLYPVWQGMQYMRDMMEGRSIIDVHENERYPIRWTSVDEFLLAHSN